MESAPELIVNANAGRFRREPALLDRLRLLARDRARVSVTQHVEDLHRLAPEIARRRPPAIWLCGGDGTFMAGLTALTQAFGEAPLPVLAFIPAGTVATVARRFVGGRSPEAALLELVGRNAATVKHKTMRVTDESGTRIGFTFGTGLVARFFRAYNAHERRGRLAAFGIGLRVFIGAATSTRIGGDILDPIEAELTVDGEQRRARSYGLIVCSVLRNLGLRLQPTYRADEHEARLHLVAAPFGARELGLQAGRVLLGRPLRGEGIVDCLVERFLVGLPKEPYYVLDGELLESSAVEVAPGPRIEVARLC